MKTTQSSWSATGHKWEAGSRPHRSPLRQPHLLLLSSQHSGGFSRIKRSPRQRPEKASRRFSVTITPLPPDPASLYLLLPTLPSLYRDAHLATKPKQDHWPKCKWACTHSHSCDSHFMLITLLIYAWGSCGQRLLLLPGSLLHCGNFHKKEVPSKQRRGAAQRRAALAVFDTPGWELNLLPLP